MTTWQDHVTLEFQWGGRGRDNPLDGDWDDALWDTEGAWAGSEPFWQSLTNCELGNLTIKRGRGFLFDQYPAGTLNLRLVLSPDSQDGPIPADRWSWRSQMSIGDEIRIRGRLTATGEAFSLYRGDISNLSDQWSPYGVHFLDIAATEIIARLGRINPLEREMQGAGESSGARMHRIADVARIPQIRRLFDPGVMTLQATNLARNLAGEAEVTATSEGGDLFADTDGQLVFRQRNWWRTSPLASEIQFTWANTDLLPDPAPAPIAHPGKACPLPIQTRLNLDVVANEVNLARANGTLQTARDTASMSQHGPITYSRSDLMNISDSDVASLAAWRVAELGGRTRVIDGIPINPLGDVEAFYGITIAAGIGRLHRLVWNDGEQVTDALVWIQGIEHTITPTTWGSVLRVWDRYVYAPADGWDVDAWDEALWSDPLIPLEQGAA